MLSALEYLQQPYERGPMLATLSRDETEAPRRPTRCRGLAKPVRDRELGVQPSSLAGGLDTDLQLYGDDR